MRKRSILPIAIFLISFLILIQTELQAGAARVEVSEKEWDWGRVPSNSVVSHSFWIKNVGTDTLRGLNVSTA